MWRGRTAARWRSRCFEGNNRRSGDAGGPQIDKLKQRFQSCSAVGDGGRPRSADHGARIEQTTAARPGLDWITALRAPAIKQLRRRGRAVAALAVLMTATWPRSPAPTIRANALVVCKNPLARRRAGPQNAPELLAATENDLAAHCGPRYSGRAVHLRGRRGDRPGGWRQCWGGATWPKHFHISITDDTFSFRPKKNPPPHRRRGCARRQSMVVRTNLPGRTLRMPPRVKPVG